jgi:hypothetical protein
MAACKALELLGLEQSMFARQHKHLHAKVNPLDGNREEIIGRLGVLLDQLSEGDLESLGLRRLGAAGKQRDQAVPGIPEAS